MRATSQPAEDMKEQAGTLRDCGIPLPAQPTMQRTVSGWVGSLLNRGKTGLAVIAARAAIAADPWPALPYLLPGSALQSSGRRKEGIEAYCECVRHASKGPVTECRAVGGHK